MSALIGKINDLSQRQKSIMTHYEENFLLKNIHLNTLLGHNPDNTSSFRLYVMLDELHLKMHVECSMLNGNLDYHFYNYATEFYFNAACLEEVYTLLISHLDLVYYMS